MGEQTLLYNPGFNGILANNGLTHSTIQVVAPIANSSGVQSCTGMANRFEQLLESRSQSLQDLCLSLYQIVVMAPLIWLQYDAVRFCNKDHVHWHRELTQN